MCSSDLLLPASTTAPVTAPAELGSVEITLTSGPSGATVTVAAAENPAPDTGKTPFRLGEGDTIVDISATGAVPPYLICFPDPDGTLRLWHYEGTPPAWRDITWLGIPVADRAPYVADHQVCGKTQSLSPFIAALSKPVPVMTAKTSKGRQAKGKPVTLSATLGGTDGTPTGSVTFRIGTATGKTIGSCTLSGGTCTVTTRKLPAGKLRIWAGYAGDVTYAIASKTFIQTILAPTLIGPWPDAGPSPSPPAHGSAASPAPTPG